MNDIVEQQCEADAYIQVSPGLFISLDRPLDERMRKAILLRASEQLRELSGRSLFGKELAPIIRAIAAVARAMPGQQRIDGAELNPWRRERFSGLKRPASR